MDNEKGTACCPLDDKMYELERNLLKANQNLRSKEQLVKLQTDQIQKMEEMYKNTLDENENLNYKHKKMMHDLENMKIILKQYEHKSDGKKSISCQCNNLTAEDNKDSSIESLKKLLEDEILQRQTSVTLKMCDDKTLKVNSLVVGEYNEHLKDISIKLDRQLVETKSLKFEKETNNDKAASLKQESRELVLLDESYDTTSEKNKIYDKNETESTKSLPKAQDISTTITNESNILGEKHVDVSGGSRLMQHTETKVKNCACRQRKETENIQLYQIYRKQINFLQLENKKLLENLKNLMCYQNSVEEELVNARSVLYKCHEEINQKEREIGNFKPTIEKLRDELSKLAQQVSSNEEEMQQQCLMLDKLSKENVLLRSESKLRENEMQHMKAESEINLLEIEKLKDDLNDSENYREKILTVNAECICNYYTTKLRSLNEEDDRQLKTSTTEMCKSNNNEYLVRNASLTQIDEELTHNEQANQCSNSTCYLIADSVLSDRQDNNEPHGDLLKLETDLKCLIDIFYQFKNFAYGEFQELLEKNDELAFNYNILCEKVEEYKMVHANFVVAQTKLEEILQLTIDKCQSLANRNIQLKQQIELQDRKSTEIEEHNKTVQLNEIKALSNYDDIFENFVNKFGKKMNELLEWKMRVRNEKQEQLEEEKDETKQECTGDCALENAIKKTKSLISVAVGTESYCNFYCSQKFSDHKSEFIADNKEYEEIYNELKESYEQYKKDANDVQELMSKEIVALQEKLLLQKGKGECLEKNLHGCAKINNAVLEEQAKTDEDLMVEIKALNKEMEIIKNDYYLMNKRYDKCVLDNEEMLKQQASLLKENEQLRSDLENITLITTLESSIEGENKKEHLDLVLEECEKYKEIIHNLQTFIDEICQNQYIYYDMQMQYKGNQENKLVTDNPNPELIDESTLLKKQLGEMKEIKENLEFELMENVNENELMKVEMSRLTDELQALKQQQNIKTKLDDDQIASIPERERNNVTNDAINERNEYKTILSSINVLNANHLKKRQEYRKQSELLMNEMQNENQQLIEIEDNKKRNRNDVETINGNADVSQQRSDSIRSGNKRLNESKMRKTVEQHTQAKAALESNPHCSKSVGIALPSSTGGSFLQSLVTYDSRFSNPTSSSDIEKTKVLKKCACRVNNSCKPERSSQIPSLRKGEMKTKTTMIQAVPKLSGSNNDGSSSKCPNKIIPKPSNSYSPKRKCDAKSTCSRQRP